MPAPFASDPARSRGRLHPQPPSATRDAFARDRDRIVHSAAFRRLRGKTQVFVAVEHDHYRVRLTHSLEVAQIARTLARALGLDEALTEAVALAHDLGHPPFGHGGEAALDDALSAAGGWDHNGHTLRIITRLEMPYPGFDGLNLSWETLEGLAKHNGPVLDPGWAMREADAAWPLELTTQPSLEAQLAALADDIAYDCHDLDDGHRAGLLPLELVMTQPFLARHWAEARARLPGVDAERLWPQFIRDLIGVFTTDVLAETQRRLAEAAPASPDAVRHANRPLAGFSPPMAEAERQLKAFLYANMYLTARVERVNGPARTMLAQLYGAVAADPGAAGLHPPTHEPERSRTIADHLAALTDRAAIRLYERLVGPSPLPADMF
jgi:dGTPase